MILLDPLVRTGIKLLMNSTLISFYFIYLLTTVQIDTDTKLDLSDIQRQVTSNMKLLKYILLNIEYKRTRNYIMFKYI